MLPWRELWAAQDLRDRIRADRELPDDFREQLERLLEGRIRRMREDLATAEALARAARPEPPPAAAVPPPPTPASLPPPLEPTAPIEPVPLEAPEPHDAPTPAPTPARPRAPTVWQRLGPAFAENLGFGLAAFLIVAGAVYFTTTAWTTMSGAQRLMVVAGGLVLLGGVLFAAARLLNRAGNLPEVERTLLLIVAFLIPIAAIPAGTLFPLSTWRALLATGIVFGGGWFAARHLARVLGDAHATFLPSALIALSALSLLGGAMPPAAPVVSALIIALFLIGVTWLYARRVVPRLESKDWRALWPTILFAFAAVVAVGRLAIAGRATWSMGTSLSTLGIVIAALGGAVVTCEPALYARRLLGRRRSAVLLVVAMALGITGTLMALGDDVGLLVASLLGAYACLRAGFALPVPWFALPGLVLSALAYLKSPAPIRAAALQLRDQAADALGYADRPMPLAWYGMTFLPYVFLCACAGWILLRRDEAAKARVLLAWSFVAAVGLSALALFASGDPVFSDLRAPAAVFAAQGGLLLAMGVALRGRWFTFGGAAGVIAGLACAVLHYRPSAPIAVLALAALGVVALGACARLAREGTEAHTAVRAGLIDATALLTLVLVVVATVDALTLAPAPAWHALGHVLLTVLVAAVAFSVRRPEGVALAGVALGAAGVRLVAGLAPDAGGDVYFLVLALVSGAVLLAPRVERLLPEALRHPLPAAPASLGSWTPFGAMAIQVLGLILLLRYLPEPGWTLTLAIGLLVAAGVLATAAAREAQPWPLYPGVCELVAAGVVAGTALTSGRWYGTGGLLGTAGSLALVCAPLLFDRPRALTERLRVPLRHLLPVLVTGFAVWAFGLVVAWWAGEAADLDGWRLLVAALAVALVVRATLVRHLRSHAVRAATLYAGTLFAPAAAGPLIARHPVATHTWALACLAAAAVTWVWAGRDRRIRPPAVLHLVLALAFATWSSAMGTGDPYVLLGAFLLCAGGGWVTARRVPVLGWCLLLVALLLGISMPLCARILHVELTYQPAVWLLFAAAAYAALAVRGLGVDARAVRIVADPILSLGVIGALMHAVHVTVLEPTTARVGEGLPITVAGLRVAEGALGLAALARSLTLPFPALGRRTLALFIIGIVTFAFAPVNMAIHGSDAWFWRPDVELALIAVLLAAIMRRAEHPRFEDGSGRLGQRTQWPILLALVGVGLTVAELRDLSTPLTVLGFTAALTILVVRDRGPRLGTLAAAGTLATALAFASWWRPMPGTIHEGILLLYAAVCALVAPLLGLTARRLTTEGNPPWRVRTGREVYPVAVLAACLTFAFVIADVGANAGRQASALEVALAVIGLLAPGLAAAWGALRASRPRLVHVALGAGLLLYTFLVQRTASLDLFDGYHLHVLTAIGSSLLFVADRRSSALARLLAIDGTLLAVPAAARYAPAAVGLMPHVDGTASALALAAVASAAAAKRLALPALYAAAAVLVNLMLYSFWRQNGLVDPAFYGIPPGLTLLAAAMLLRGRISSPARLALVVPGLALLYGSVAIQVVRADEPVHALLLFGLGFLTVVLGFWARRNAWMVVGVVVIVLDVVTYLLVHGFETGFFGAALLIVAGLVVMAVAAITTTRRRRQAAADADDAEGARDA